MASKGLYKKGSDDYFELDKPEHFESSEQNESKEHRSADRSSRFAVDKLFRILGFAIKSRPTKKDAIWIGPDKKEYTQASVVEKLEMQSSTKALLEDALYEEELYLDIRYLDLDSWEVLENADEFDFEKTLEKDMGKIFEKENKK